MDTAFIDTFLLAFPSDDCDLIGFDLYIRRLLEWRELIHAEAFPTYISAIAPSVLGRLGGFPPWRKVAESIERLSPPGVHAGDVFSILQYFLDRLPKVEENIGIREILVEDVHCDPDTRLNRADTWADDLERLMALIALFAKLRGEANESRYIFTKELSPCPARVRFEGALIDVECEPDRECLDRFPVPLEGAFEAFSCARNFRSSIDPERIWSNAMSREACQLAVQLSVQRMQRLTGQLDHRPWALGNAFLSSIVGSNLGAPEKGRAILRAAAETILDQNMRSTHALRGDKKAGSPQRTRGDDRAWRRDVDYEYHLHYWSGPTGLELAAVVNHNEFDIPG